MLTANAVVTHAVGKPLRFAGSSMAQAISGDLAMGGSLAGFDPIVIHSSRPTEGRVSQGGLQIGTGSGSSRGIYIPAVQDKVTTGVLTGGAHFAYSDQFGGCDFTMLRDSGGNLVACHVYSSAPCRSAVAGGGLPVGWTHIYTWRSSPYAQQWGYASIHCLAVLRGTKLTLVALKITGREPTVEDARLSAEVNI